MSSNKLKKLFKTREPQLTDYIGRFVHVDGEKILIKHITGNIWHPKYAEINGQHRISFLRLFKQMTYDKSITEEQLLAFEDMDVSARKLTPEELSQPPHKDVSHEETEPPTEPPPESSTH